MSDLEFRPNPRMFSRIGTFTVTGYTGGYSFDRKSNSLMLGGRLGYYVFDAVEVEGGVSWTRVNRPAEIVESLFDLRLEAEKFHMLFYELNVNAKLLPGRQLDGGLGLPLAEMAVIVVRRYRLIQRRQGRVDDQVMVSGVFNIGAGWCHAGAGEPEADGHRALDGGPILWGDEIQAGVIGDRRFFLGMGRGLRRRPAAGRRSRR